MSLTLTQDPRSKIYYITGSILGQRIRRSTKTASKLAAERMYIKALKDVERTLALGEKASFTFAQAVNFYIKRKQVNHNLALNIKKALEYFKEKPCSQITQAEMTAYEEHRYKRKFVQDSTRIQACIVTVQSIINFAADYGLCERVRFRRPKLRKKPVIAAPDTWIKQLLSKDLPQWLRCVILMLTYQGVRPISMNALSWGEVDFEENRITFLKTKNFHVFAPKMHPEVRQALKTLREQNPEESLVFPMLKERHPASYINTYLRYLCKKYKIPFYSTHKLGRHAFAHRLFKDRCSTQEVAQAGGWESDRVVSIYYGHLQRSHVDELVCKTKIGGRNADTETTGDVSLHS